MKSRHLIDATAVSGQKAFVRELGADFNKLFANTVARLDAMLHLNLVKMLFERYYKGPIGMQLKSVRRYDATGKHAIRDWEVYRLGLLTMELELLKKENKPLFNQFKKLLKKATQNEYFGLRFEISTAADLQRSPFDFIKRERPDFEVETEFGKAFIECVSTNLENTKLGDLTYKIVQAIEKKKQKGYENSEQTVLFVDFTNVYFHSTKVGSPLDFDLMQVVAEEALAKSEFGAVAVLALFPAIDEGLFVVGGRVSRNTTISKSLECFLGKFFSEEVEIKHGASFSF